MPDLPIRLLMRIHFTNGRRTKELKAGLDVRMDGNPYISLAGHFSTTKEIPSPR